MPPKPKQVWRSDLPERKTRHYDWHAITADLRARPGEWLLIAEDAAISLAPAINRQRVTPLRSDGEWTYLTRTFDNNKETRTCTLWMSAVRKDETNGG